MPATPLSSIGRNPPWKGEILRCIVRKASPILFPLRPDLWNTGHAVCLRLEPDELVLCVRDEGSFQVLYRETVWETEPGYFRVEKGD